MWCHRPSRAQRSATLVERIDRAGVGRAGVRHHGKRQQPLSTIFRYRVGEGADIEAITIVGCERRERDRA